MITHYGLNWSEADVLWSGWKGTPASLLGREREPLGRKGAPTAAQRDRATDYQYFVGLYCLYGDSELIYVGEAGLGTAQTLFSRLKAHRRGPLSGRWDSFSWFGRANCDGDTDCKIALQQLEAISIAIINPGFNKQAGAFGGAHQVYQVPHPDSDGDIFTRLSRIEETIDDIWDHIVEKSR